MNYTKGEWKVIQRKAQEVPFFDGFTLSVQSEELVIALCDREKWDNKKQRLGNAHLIAAAPEMYEALVAIGDLLFGLPENELRLKALTKAEGKSKKQ